jgi:hypothetical protein
MRSAVAAGEDLQAKQRLGYCVEADRAKMSSGVAEKNAAASCRYRRGPQPAGSTRYVEIRDTIHAWKSAGTDAVPHARCIPWRRIEGPHLGRECAATRAKIRGWRGAMRIALLPRDRAYAAAKVKSTRV